MTKPGLPKDVPYRSASGRHGVLRVAHDQFSDTAIVDFPGDAIDHLPASSLRVTLYSGQPYLDLELTIKNKAKDNWPEADWLCLPFRVKDPQYRVGRSLGIMDPAHDILRGANRHLCAVGAGVTLIDADGAGISLCPLDHPLISLDTPGIWKYSLDFVPKKPVIFLNLYNNQYNTNYRYWYPGTWSSRVRIWPSTDLTVLSWSREILQPTQWRVAPHGTVDKTKRNEAESSSRQLPAAKSWLLFDKTEEERP